MSFSNSIFSNNTSSGQVYNHMKQAMGAVSKREEVISNNIANVNTKGYKRFDVVLKDEINNKNDISLKRTHSKHLQDGSVDSSYEVKRDDSSSMRLDGNNVDVDVEMSNLAANSILFNSLVTSINNEYSMKSNVIRGGK